MTGFGPCCIGLSRLLRELQVAAFACRPEAQVAPIDPDRRRLGGCDFCSLEGDAPPTREVARAPHKRLTLALRGPGRLFPHPPMTGFGQKPARHPVVGGNRSRNCRVVWPSLERRPARPYAHAIPPNDLSPSTAGGCGVTCGRS